MGPNLFNIHINNISKECHNSDVALFANDTEIQFSSEGVGEAEYRINEDFKSFNQWFSNNGLICNTKRTVIRPDNGYCITKDSQNCQRCSYTGLR